MKKNLLSLALVLALTLTAASALAQGPGYGRGMGYGPGYGPGYHHNMGPGWGPGQGPMAYGPGYQFDEETAKIMGQLHQKGFELQALLAAKELDEAKIKTVHGEMTALKNQLSDKRLADMIEFRKNNPDLPLGPGYGPGPGAGYGPGRGYGPGYCWR